MTVCEILQIEDIGKIQEGFDAALQRANEAQLAFAQAVAQSELTAAAHDRALGEASAARAEAFATRDQFKAWVTALQIINERLNVLSQLEAN